MSFLVPLIAVGTAAFAVEIPFFFLGTPSGHDVEFHLNSWLEVLMQWKHGIFFPRWASLANFGYGEPRFIFYPPVSWLLGASLAAVFPWTLVSAIFIWLVLTLSGMSMFMLARRWFNRRTAIFASALYAVNPYHLVIVYWRSAFAELLASCLLPMLFLLILRIEEGNRRVTIPLAMVLSAAWLTNAPAAVMIHYSLALLLLILAWKQRTAQILTVGGGAIVLGACLAAFYLIPAVYEQRWVDIGQAISAGSRPQDNFLFIHTGDGDHDHFNHVISWVALLEMGVILGTGVAARIRQTMQKETWTLLAAWAFACSVLLFPLTALLWRIFPKLEFMQFPWRWLLCLSMIFCLFVTAGAHRWWMRSAICAVAILTIALTWHFIQQPWWDAAADLRELQDNVTDHIGYEGTDEYTPTGADPSALNKDAPNVGVIGAGPAKISISQWDAESKRFTAELLGPTQLQLRLFQYPAWKAVVNGKVVQATKGNVGQLLVPVESGMNDVQIKFIRTWDQTLGDWISLITAFCMGGWFVLTR
ncbi:MAG TPA: 6-pyruvoyl-tetrahydropterin synthase-related protein [Verrucomicrobiae bacterium]|nr:6-pyruvoyl-tetrahydropterin synthase-related protein [Verrucomicrobiae bacterium]